MMPPLCDVCGAVPSGGSAEGFGTLIFADYIPLPEGRTGHPGGLIWFCSEHLEQARGLTHLNSADALGRLTPDRNPDREPF